MLISSLAFEYDKLMVLNALTRRIGICAIRRVRIGSSIGKALSGIDRGVRACRSSSDRAKQEYR